jgi:hypothetical protein
VLTTAAGHWYTSPPFFGTAGLVIGVLAVWATLFAASTKRRITVTLAEDTPLLATTTALRQGELEIRFEGQMVTAPRVVTVLLESGGRRDIGSADFDQERALAIDLGVSIVRLLAAKTAPKMPESAFAVEGTRVLIGPCAIRKRQVISLAFLVDGGQPRLSRDEYSVPLNVDVREVPIEVLRTPGLTLRRHRLPLPIVWMTLIWGLWLLAFTMAGLGAGNAGGVIYGLSIAVLLVGFPVIRRILSWLDRRRLRGP